MTVGAPRESRWLPGRLSRSAPAVVQVRPRSGRTRRPRAAMPSAPLRLGELCDCDQ